jgi:peptidoglycan/LPS O-acetylase OafA/YrhL
MSSANLEAAIRPRERYEFLDFVRGVAALAVFLQHAVGHLWPDFNEFRRVWFDLGNFGVVVFFLTSGFIIPESLHRGGSVGRFWVGRFFRLYPLYWLSLALALVYHLGGYESGHELETAFRANIPVYSLVNVTMFQQFVGVPNAITPYWTLSLELLFYLSCTALFVLGARDAVKTAYVVIALGVLGGVVVPLVTGIRTPIGMIFFVMTMFTGTVLFRYHGGEISRSRCLGVFVAVALAAAAGILINSLLIRSANPHANTAQSLALTWLAGYLFFAWAFFRRGRTFPGVWLWLGAVSYSLYLMHHSVVYVVFPDLHQTLPRPLALAVILSASLAVAAVTYYLVERPGIRLGRMVQGRLFGRSRGRTSEGAAVVAQDELVGQPRPAGQDVGIVSVSHTG